MRTVSTPATAIFWKSWPSGGVPGFTPKNVLGGFGLGAREADPHPARNSASPAAASAIMLREAARDIGRAPRLTRPMAGRAYKAPHPRLMAPCVPGPYANGR